MERSFPETLAALRREKNINQRRAAAELGISQALLSHYENGAREPGLNFVCRACDYYGVTADYLLCRSEVPNPKTEIKNNTLELVESLRAIIDKAQESINQLSTEEDEA